MVPEHTRVPWLRLPIVLVLGAVLGTLYDYIHVWFGVLAYERPDFFGTKLALVPAEFGLSGIAASIALVYLADRWPAPKTTGWRAAFDGVLLLLAYLCTGIFLGNNAATAAGLLALAALSVLTRPSRFVALVSVGAAVVGPVGETLISRAGMFHYAYPSQYVPYWLPLLWIVAAGTFIDAAVLLLNIRQQT